MQFIDLKAQQARVRDKISARLEAVLDHGAYIMGPEISELETALSGFCGAKHSISCSSGTDALVLPLMAMGIGAGDAVIVPAFTFAATAEVVAFLGATPIFADVQRDTFNIDIESIKSAITEAKNQGLKLKAIMPVGLFGQPADFEAIWALAKEEGVYIIDDAAQSFGASYRDQKVGTLADVTSTSFFPAKPLGCYGDGGGVFTDNDELCDLMKSIRVHGQGSNKYENVRLGMNARMDSMQAGVLIEKLAIFPDEIVSRQRVADKYNDALRDFCQVPDLPNWATSVWAQYTLVVDDRDALSAHLKEKGVPNVVYYPIPLNQQKGYNMHPVAPAGLSNSEYLSEHVLSLPMHPYLSDEEIEQITSAVLSFKK